MDRPCAVCGQKFAVHPRERRRREYCCEACRVKAWRSAHPTPKRPASKTMPCSGCGKDMWRGATSLPQGQAACLDCRRAKMKPKFKPELRECKRCCSVFEANRDSQKYCVPCRAVRSSGFGKKRDRADPAQRGYGAAHRKERAKWKLIVDRGDARCCLCGDYVDPDMEWHLDHTPDRSGYRGVAHASCNRKDGARRGRARQSPETIGRRETQLRW